MIKIVSKKTHDLKKSEIMDIIKLKETYWKYGIQSQKKWFKKYVGAKDIHNMVLLNNKFIGYTLLRPRKLISKNCRKYLYFDTLILKKKFRNKKYSSNLMDFNNTIIKKNKKISFLITLKKLEKYYIKHGWKTLSKKSFKICDHKQHNIGMIYNNFKGLNNFKFYLYE
tara:strand:- start:26 stop:529 length:504 start_codon:yes stop_codon:yes gene_type:complete